MLRRKFDDPRIHFVIVCASVSCARLSRDAYIGDKLEVQLESATKDFINDKAKNNIMADKAQISKYFTWYKGDFTNKGSVADYINKYSQTKITANTKINYLDYNWSLNEQK